MRCGLAYTDVVLCAASIALGLCSVPALYTLSRMVFPKSVSSMNQLVAGLLVGFAFLGYIAYKIEQNDFPFFRIPRKECTCHALTRNAMTYT
jgi:phosphate starvation-inducible membrane PsiE